jgi:hypothetical protein
MIDVSHSNQQEKNSSVGGLFLRLFWMFLGNMVLGVSALLIVQAGASFSPMDILYWLTVPLLVAARYAEISWYKGVTAYGEPASMAHWRRYTVGLLLSAVGVWLTVHGAGYLFAK